MSPRYDIVILGAGVAGLVVAGEVLRQDGLRVLLVDGRREAYSRTPLTFVDLLEQFDLQESILSKYQNFSMHSPLGSQSLHHFQKPVLAAVDYRQLCQLLADRIAGHSSLCRVYAQVTELARRGKEWDIRLSDGQRLCTSLIVDASGLAQVSAKVLGRRRSRLYSHCYGERLEGCETKDDGVCYYLGGGARFGTGGGWFYPLGKGQVSFGYARVNGSPEYPASRVYEGYTRARVSFAPYASIVTGSRRVGVEAGTIPVGLVWPLVEDGLMRVGDAGGQATPWVCMGVEPALVNGCLCGRVAVEACRRGDLRAANLRAYERMWRQANGPRYRQAMLLAAIQWVDDEQRWDRAIAAQNRFTPEEMLAKLRENYPLWPLTTLYLFRLYALLGRIRSRICK